MKRRTWQCFRCKKPKVVGEEIARCDLHAICYACLGATSHHSAAQGHNGHAAPVKTKRVRKAPPGPNRSLPQKPDTE